jgi:hypothetical protein
MIEGVQEGMRLLPGARKAIPTKASEQPALSSAGKCGQEGNPKK